MHANLDKVSQMGSNARKYAEENVSKSKAVGQYIEIIEDTVQL